ncbi:MAG: RagB/SusD family nutrient uptake outer membrane protein [Tidjanibacter sp.]|nr:RagB/SusD family nutrient uptake outer membrane protein [Tidjanibacter sp.]
MTKRIFFLVVPIVFLFQSCQNDFLETPPVTGMTLEEVFSTSKNVEGAIAEAYSTILSSGLPVYSWNAPYLPYEATEAIMGGEDICNLTWGYMDKLCQAGMIPNNENKGAGYTDDYFPNNFIYIRKAWIVYENIDLVSDMSERDKAIVKAEMQTLVAFRYVEMMKRYGGVPIVRGTLTSSDAVARSSVADVLDFIVGLCNDAATTLDGVKWSNDWRGRINKGTALAVKAEALMYAARPLFNAAEPFMGMANPDDNNLVWLGGFDAERWKAAAEANEAVIEWGKSNGYELIDTDNPSADFGTAVGTPSNREVLLAYKHQMVGDNNGIYKNYSFLTYHTSHDLGWYRGISYELLCQFHKADGTDQHWINKGETLPCTDYREKAMQLEPRALMSLFFYGISPQNNLLSGNSMYDIEGDNWRLYYRGQDGCARNCKFWYEANGREWFEFPIYRMAEFYLNAAEAYNEYGNNSSALKYLNPIRNRAGLDNVVESNQGRLRSIIQREWAVEFYNENQYYPHARHWKTAETMIGGTKHGFLFTRADGVTWNPQRPAEFGNYSLVDSYIGTYVWKQRMYLTPISLGEVNKGVILQNPGY